MLVGDVLNTIDMLRDYSPLLQHLNGYIYHSEKWIYPINNSIPANEYRKEPVIVIYEGHAILSNYFEVIACKKA
jgi:hypothetical protein